MGSNKIGEGKGGTGEVVDIVQEGTCSLGELLVPVLAEMVRLRVAAVLVLVLVVVLLAELGNYLALLEIFVLDVVVEDTG